MSNDFVIIKMCFVYNQWYDISCATLYITCPVHFIHLNFNFDDIWWSTKYYEIHYAYFATSYYYPLHPVSRSDLSILRDTSLSYTRRTRTMVYALRNRRKFIDVIYFRPMESWSGRLVAGLSYRMSYSWLAEKQNKCHTLAKSFRQIS